MTPTFARVVVAALAGVAAGCAGDGRVLLIGVEGGAAWPAEVRAGDTLRLVATLQGAGEAAAAGRVVSNAPDTAWRATPAGMAAFAPTGDADDPVAITLRKAGNVTIWATFERLESESVTIAVRAAAR